MQHFKLFYPECSLTTYVQHGSNHQKENQAFIIKDLLFNWTNQNLTKAFTQAVKLSYFV